MLKATFQLKKIKKKKKRNQDNQMSVNKYCYLIEQTLSSIVETFYKKRYETQTNSILDSSTKYP